MERLSENLCHPHCVNWLGTNKYYTAVIDLILVDVCVPGSGRSLFTIDYIASVYKYR